ncbi:MAG: peptide deformylase [Mycoplasma sp.]
MTSTLKKIKPKVNLKPLKSWIYLDSDPLLKQKSEHVAEITDNDEKIIHQMMAYVDASYDGTAEENGIRPGIAIAAPQMGLLKKIIYIHFEDGTKEYKYLLANPEIKAKSQLYSFIENGEGCLSVPKDVKGNIPRNYKIIVKAFDLLNGKEIEISAVELLSICLQHEIDHLDGILYTDRIDPKNPMHIDPKWLVVR